MFDAVRNNKRIVQVFLGLIILPFAFWGVDSYFRSSSGADELAKVGGSPISRQEFSLAMRDQQERLRGRLGREFNPAMLETPEARLAMLDSLVTQRLLLLHSLLLLLKLDRLGLALHLHISQSSAKLQALHRRFKRACNVNCVVVRLHLAAS